MEVSKMKNLASLYEYEISVKFLFYSSPSLSEEVTNWLSDFVPFDEKGGKGHRKWRKHGKCISKLKHHKIAFNGKTNKTVNTGKPDNVEKVRITGKETY